MVGRFFSASNSSSALSTAIVLPHDSLQFLYTLRSSSSFSLFSLDSERRMVGMAYVKNLSRLVEKHDKVFAE